MTILVCLLISLRMFITCWTVLPIFNFVFCFWRKMHCTKQSFRTLSAEECSPDTIIVVNHCCRPPLLSSAHMDITQKGPCVTVGAGNTRTELQQLVEKVMRSVAEEAVPKTPTTEMGHQRDISQISRFGTYLLFY